MLIGKARKRSRRPTADELARLRHHFDSRDRRAKIPMRPIIDFAIASARREAEICRLEWLDNDAETRTGIVRDAKHPTAREGNHRRFRCPPEAWAIVEAQPRTSPYVFPYDPKSVGSAFTRACQLLGIKDLHFHDLSHEATSRLFERGYQIHEAAQFTLHDSWNELKRSEHRAMFATIESRSATLLHVDRGPDALMTHDPARKHQTGLDILALEVRIRFQNGLGRVASSEESEHVLDRQTPIANDGLTPKDLGVNGDARQ
jgi:Phage integrase family